MLRVALLQSSISQTGQDRKSTRLNSSHLGNSYAVFCLKKKTFWGPSAKGSMRRDYAKSIYQNSLATAYLRFDFQQDFHMNLPIKTATQVSYDYRKLDYNNFFSQGLNLPQYPPFIISTAEQKTSGDGSFQYLTFGYLFNQTV